MIVRKIRGEERIGKIILSRTETEVCKRMGVSLELYVKNMLLKIAKQRRWKWYLNKDKK